MKDGALITAPLDEWILPGIQRAHLIMAAKRLGMPVEERPYDLTELFNADEILVTDSANFALRVDTVDGKPAGMKDSALYEKLRKEVVDEFLNYTK